jgi:hypothetical protein
MAGKRSAAFFRQLRRFYVKDVHENSSSRFDVPNPFIFNDEDSELCSVVLTSRIYIGHYWAHAKTDGIWTNSNDKQIRRCWQLRHRLSFGRRRDH